MQTPPETMPTKESADPKTKPVETNKGAAVAKGDDQSKVSTKDSEPKPTTAGNGGEAVKTGETNSKAEPKAKTPEAVEPKPKEAEQPKVATKETTTKVENSKTESGSKPKAEEVSTSKTSEKTAAAEDEPMDTQDGGDDKKEEESDNKVEAKPEPKQTEEEKPAAKRGRKRKAEVEQKAPEAEATTSRAKRTREVQEEKVEETRGARKRAVKTDVSMKEAAGSEEEDDDEPKTKKRGGPKRAAQTKASMKEDDGSEYDENNDDDDDDEEPKTKKRAGRPPKSGKAAVAKQPKQPKYTGPTIDIPTIEGNTIACSAGDGEVGQLGIGEQGENGKSRFVPIGEVPDKVVRCAAGGMHSLLLTEKGEIFSFGCNDDGSLGRPTENEEECFVPKITPMPEPVAKLAAGNIHSVAVTKNCKVFIWGSYRDNNGAFGIQPEGDAPLKKPTELKVPEPIVDVSCGSEHTLLLSNKGTIYSMGVGEQGRLGRLKSSHCGRENRRARQTLLTPVKVPVRKRSIKFDRVWAGRFNTFARSTDGSIWGCGLNNYGQLGELDSKSMEDNFVFFLTQLKSFDPKIKWEHIAGGEQHTLALDADGSVYSMGRVLYGRLGLGKKDANDPDVTKPTLIPELEKKCTLIAAGDHTSFALDKDGQLWSWGQGTNLLGQGSRDDADTMDIFVPTLCTSKTLKDHKVVFASAGSNHALCIVKSE